METTSSFKCELCLVDLLEINNNVNGRAYKAVDCVPLLAILGDCTIFIQQKNI